MTPLMIEILLHYYCRGVDFPNLNAPAVKDALQYFVSLGILKDHTMNDKGPNEMEHEPNREALEVYVRALEAVPLPVQRWVIPINPPQ